VCHKSEIVARACREIASRVGLTEHDNLIYLNNRTTQTSRGQLIAGCLTIILLALFIFSSTNGDITVQQDDVLFMSHSAINSWNYFHEARYRAFLTPFYTLIYDINGQDTWRTHLFYFALFVLSALLLYAVLLKLLGAAPALLGAFFYLAYTGKYETVTWMSAGAYLVTANVLFLSVWIALSNRLGPWEKGGLIAAINWLNVLLCELLIVLAPFYPLLYWLHRRLRRQPIEPRVFAATFLPLLAFLFHVSVIYLSTPKGVPLLWQRNGDRLKESQLNILLAQVRTIFRSGLTTGMGDGHFVLLGHGVEGFWKYVPHGAYAAITALGVCAGVAFLLRTAPVIRPEKAIMIPLLIVGTYLVLFSPLIGFTANPLFVPSRMLTLVGIGLSLLAAAAASWALASRMAVLRYAIPAVLLAVSGAEAMAMNSILYEHETSWAHDSYIRTQLLATGIRPRMGDTIFMSLPVPPLMRDYWRSGFSQFGGGHIQTIMLMDYGMKFYDSEIRPAILYVNENRGLGTPPPAPVARPGHQLYCFYVSDNDYRLTRSDCPKAQ
jgi:hypothetical protein